MSQPPPAGVRRTGHHGRTAPTPDQQEHLRAVGLRAYGRRQFLNVTRRDIARYLGWSDTKVANIENARAGASLLDITDLADALRCDPAWLAYGTGVPVPATASP